MNVRNVRNDRFGMIGRDTQYAGAHRPSVRDIGVLAYSRRTRGAVSGGARVQKIAPSAKTYVSLRIVGWPMIGRSEFDESQQLLGLRSDAVNGMNGRD